MPSANYQLCFHAHNDLLTHSALNRTHLLSLSSKKFVFFSFDMPSELPLGFPHLLCAPQHGLYFNSDHTSAVCTLSFFLHFDTGSSMSQVCDTENKLRSVPQGVLSSEILFGFLFSFGFFLQDKVRCEKIKKENFSFTILNRTNVGILSIWSCYRIDFFSHFFSDLSQN